jgi:prolyl oligopeptidase
MHISRPAIVNLAIGCLSLAVYLLGAAYLFATATQDATDPFLWLEDVHGARAMEWVEAQNAKTTAVLESDPRFKTLFSEAKALAETKDRIPTPQIIDGNVYNFWQDQQHAHGIWRRVTLQDYQSPAPAWVTVLDLDALSKAENANWFWKGAICEEPAEKRCMLALSDGGEDALTLREFDLSGAAFVAGGFNLPRGKQELAWEGPDTLLVAREWAAGELTRSGYPFVVKRIERGQPLEAAAEVFRGAPNDVGVSPERFDDGAGHHAVIIARRVSFFQTELHLIAADRVLQLGAPSNADLIGMVDGRLVDSIHEDWRLGKGRSLPQGSLVAFDLAAAAADPAHLHPTSIYSPGPREAVDSAIVTHGYLLVTILDNVNGRAFSYKPEAGHRWSRRPLQLPDKAAINIVDADLRSDHAFVSVTGFLNPSQMELLDLASGSAITAKALPPQFDASHDVVEQYAATSQDGTRVPYFVVHPIGMPMDGSTPTILNAYGGFLVANTPFYSADMGKLWLERGGAFVLANIRGGGEFGPAWHEAGLKTHRQRIYDDFAAVGKDLVAKGFTSPQHLGIMGGSNGGLLMGVEFTQHPEMWGAVDIQVPLLDMLRFEQIAAGSSWVGEYGSVANPRERAFLASISPYNNLHNGTRYPEPLIWTTTKDDRVGPQHARKFAAKLAAMGVPYLYFEVIEGGHASSATPVEHAQMAAREYTYFLRSLEH